jgi:uncharacterized protein with FMN-binding domain
MKRAPLVIASTVVGLVGVMSFHTSPPKVSLGSLTASTPTPTTRSNAGSSQTSAGAGTTSGSQGTSTSAGTPATGTPATGTSTSGTRTAVGAPVNYYFGVLSVKVTATGNKVTKVSLASIQDGGYFRSQQIDQYSTPILEQEAVQAGNANIQSVSGASYTSAGFQQSLQSALTKLGI